MDLELVSLSMVLPVLDPELVLEPNRDVDCDLVVPPVDVPELDPVLEPDMELGRRDAVLPLVREDDGDLDLEPNRDPYLERQDVLEDEPIVPVNK